VNEPRPPLPLSYLGALIGSAVGHPGAGAAIGGVGGAAVGYGIGNHMQNEQDQRAYRNGYY
jgi:outer membrane protein with glycine zipper